jgi:hypothetical protein
MSEFELFFDLQSDYGDGIVLNKYGDRFSLIAARKSSKAEGTIWKDFCFPQDKDKKPRAKAIPLGVRLGNMSEARKFARWLLSNLDPGAKAPVNDDDPF